MPRASKNKDPNAPKRPLSAFFIFSQDERPAIKQKNSTLLVADVAKQIGERWRGASEDVKKKYEKLAKEAKKNMKKRWLHIKILLNIKHHRKDNEHEHNNLVHLMMHTHTLIFFMRRKIVCCN